MTGKEYRMGRLFQQDGRTVVLPVDHGVALGHVAGLRNPGEVLRTLVEVGPDAVLLNPGLSRAASDVFSHRTAPARILTVDNFYMDSTTLAHYRIGWAEKAVTDGYDAIKVLFPWDGTIQERVTTTRLVAEMIQEADKWQIPIIVEPTLLREAKPDPDRLSDCVRIAFELGADILKTPYPGRIDVLQEWVESFRVPIILLGGPKGSSDAELLQAVADAMRAGARGVAIGRNVWQRELADAVQFFRELVNTVHPDLR
ncbi:hypothetical protein LLE49_18420 [Alicyclobacillus tolerans]|uniref:class I fructose-bisphosphate aldolase n=1 Tax=Alicyclobacillus tolerans TaxID=90970 RepID=UPI001F363A36|nr:hypothetical protein [Alicyclobacillus tolerans]MCF8566704.1 hypothetical protein [Alicyclobacillus tolerans]